VTHERPRPTNTQHPANASPFLERLSRIDDFKPILEKPLIQSNALARNCNSERSSGHRRAIDVYQNRAEDERSSTMACLLVSAGCASSGLILGDTHGQEATECFCLHRPIDDRPEDVDRSVHLLLSIPAIARPTAAPRPKSYIPRAHLVRLELSAAAYDHSEEVRDER
jgi:hypothetical protein